MIKVPGRLLTPPRLKYGVKADFQQIKDGDWNMRNTKFHRPIPVRYWTYLFLHFAEKTKEYGRILSNDPGNRRKVFEDEMANLGLGNAKPNPSGGYYAQLSVQNGQSWQSSNDSVIGSILKEASATMSANGAGNKAILLVVLPDENAFNYSRVKYWADVKFGE